MVSHSKFQKEGRHGTDHQVPIQDSRRRKRRDDPKNHDNIRYILLPSPTLSVLGCLLFLVGLIMV